jgi:hypothetical protein
MNNNQKYNHVRFLKVGKSTMAEEVLILAEDANNVYFIRTNELDEIDRIRMASILDKRNASHYPLWDLLDQTTLGNGKNALEYFHQLAYVQNSEGELSRPGKAFGVGVRNRIQQSTQATSAEAVNVLEAAEEVARRRPGRPPKTNNA